MTSLKPCANGTVEQEPEEDLHAGERDAQLLEQLRHLAVGGLPHDPWGTLYHARA